MGNLVIIGAQWGDEGKGKIVDWLSIEADVVVRFQGGHNAGHTLVIDGKTYYVFCGRLKDLVSRGGEKINCEEVELAIAGHPAVAAVAAVTVRV